MTQCLSRHVAAVLLIAATVILSHASLQQVCEETDVCESTLVTDAVAASALLQTKSARSQQGTTVKKSESYFRSADMRGSRTCIPRVLKAARRQAIALLATGKR